MSTKIGVEPSKESDKREYLLARPRANSDEEDALPEGKPSLANFVPQHPPLISCTPFAYVPFACVPLACVRAWGGGCGDRCVLARTGSPTPAIPFRAKTKGRGLLGVPLLNSISSWF